MATFNDCATRVKAVLAGLSGAPTVDIRKVFAVHPDDATTLCIVSFGSDVTDEWATVAGTGGSTGKVFQIIVSYIAPSQGDLESSLTTVPTFWEDAKRALNLGSLSGLASVWNVIIESSEAWEKQPFGDGRERSDMGITVHCSELRNG